MTSFLRHNFSGVSVRAAKEVLSTSDIEDDRMPKRINSEDAKSLVENGCKVISEGANMPSDPEAINVFLGNNVLFGPGKAANAGGVATSGLEMSQNSMRIKLAREEVDKKFHQIMKDIH